MNDAAKNCSIGELKLLAVVCRLEKFRFYLYGEVVYLYTRHQVLEPLNFCSQTQRQNSARLTRWLDGIVHFDISIKHSAGNDLALTDYLSRHLTKETTTEETHGEEYLINTLSELFKLNHKHGRQLNTDRKFRSTGQSAHMILKANREQPIKLLPQKKIHFRRQFK